MPKSQERVIFLDVLRVLATIGVVVIHVTAHVWNEIDILSTHSFVFNAWDSFVRWSVPIFVMISGCLFLNPQKQIETKKLYTKNILRIITAFVFWSAIYTVEQAVLSNESSTSNIIGNFIRGPGHFWFLLLIIALYMFVPILRKLCESESVMKYFLLLSLIFNIVLYTAVKLLPEVLSDGHIKDLLVAVAGHYDSMHLGLISGYTFYFVAGYYLFTHDLPKKVRIALYICAVICVIPIFLLTHYHSVMADKVSDIFYDNRSVAVAVQTVAVFVFVKNIKFNLKEKSTKILLKLSKYSFGVYLVHMFILDVLKLAFNFTPASLNPFLSVPLFIVIVFIISTIISACLNKIPILNKYVV